MSNRLKLRTIRQIYATFFSILFVLLILAADYNYLKGYDVPLFLEVSPLHAVSTILSSRMLYHRLILSVPLIIFTLLFGRFFCSWVCPMGILNQIISHLLNKKRAIDDLKMNTYKTMFRFKYYLLTALLTLCAFGALQDGLFDPISLITRSFTISILPVFHAIFGGIYHHRPVFNGGILISVIFVAILFANRFHNRFWCRVLCPLGALLGIFSLRSLFGIRRDAKRCTGCNKCLISCHGGCDPNADLKHHECHVCMNCIGACPEGALSFGPYQPAQFSINRRRVLEIAAAASIFYPMLRSSRASDAMPLPSVIRPPGSIAEHDFLKRCVKCGECMKVCPTNVIQPALLEAGFEGLWTPILINKIGYCELNCVLCGRVCPTGAIMPLTVEKKNGKPPVRLGTAFYDQGRCLPWSMNIECIVCEEVCPTSPKAIKFETAKTPSGRLLKRPYIEPTLCIGCGICENKCPVADRAAVYVTSAGESRDLRNRLLLNEKFSK